MSIRRAHDLFSRIHAVATAEAVEAAATAANAQLKLEQARHRSVASSHPNSHPRGGYAKAMANRWVPPADPVAVEAGRRCLPEHDRD